MKFSYFRCNKYFFRNYNDRSKRNVRDIRFEIGRIL